MRYLQFKNTLTGSCLGIYFNVNEVYLIHNGTNVALNKPTSSFDAWSGQGVSFLVDGDNNTTHSSGTGGSANTFSRIDLQVGCNFLRQHTALLITFMP